MRPERDVVDSDVDLHDPAQRTETQPREWEFLAIIAAGGAVGAEARYGLDVALPHHADSFPWATLLTNISGCLLIGVLMVVVVEVLTPHRLLRPFLGTGILGGFTTFSTFGVDVVALCRQQRLGLALGYVLASVMFCLLAVWGASTLTRRFLVAAVPVETGR